MTKIVVQDESHNYSLLLRFSLNNNMIAFRYWFDIIDNTVEFI